jgi:hypothetical protein
MEAVKYLLKLVDSLYFNLPENKKPKIGNNDAIIVGEGDTKKRKNEIAKIIKKLIGVTFIKKKRPANNKIPLIYETLKVIKNADRKVSQKDKINNNIPINWRALSLNTNTFIHYFYKIIRMASGG